MRASRLLRSFRYALNGLRHAAGTQRNMRIHFLVALVVLILSLYLPLRKVEVLVLFVTIALVLFAELINTAVEAVVDMVTEEYHPLARIAKDVAAGAVLITAGLSVIIGISVFYPYLNGLWSRISDGFTVSANIGMAVIIVLDFFLTLLIKGWMHKTGHDKWEPSMTASIAFCVSTLIIAATGHLFIVLLVLLLLSMLVWSRMRIQPLRLPIILGAVLGTVVAWGGLQWL
ncbi:diacylglycerol kinase family protein [Staphylospora marina]|uniref:diacylglycerol kinase family protein n=1 Tax=Staphylospora marina TaxID=2490858 RepID=UPI000F5C18D3|nr:diacylglycerol kinase family protein [Staphylospora marina]